VLQVAAEVALRVGSPDRERLALELVEESRRADVGIGRALLVAGSAAASYGRFEEALVTLEEAAARAVEEGDEVAQLRIILRAASVRLELGHYDVIDELQGVASAMRDRGDPWLPVALNNLAISYERAGKFPESLAAHDEALTLRRAAGDTMGEVTTLVNSASVLVRSGLFPEARARLIEVLHHPTVGHNMLRIAAICGTAGELLAAEGSRPLEAVRLLGAHQKIREYHGRPEDAEDDAQYRPYIARLIEAVGEEAYAAAFQEGYALNPEMALPVISAALSDE
jgi:tetratricopeptide (TPR) repeat protein